MPATESEPNVKATTIQTEGLVKEYGKRKVVKGVNLNLKAGEVVGLLGPNGAGKTTLISMITGIFSPSSGDCFVAGESIR